MSTLRELTGELQAVADLANDPDMPENALIDTLDGLKGMFQEKAAAIVHVLLNSDGDIAAIDAEIARLQARKNVMKNGKERLIDYLRDNMEAASITKIEHPLFGITLGKGRESVVIDNLDDVSDEYVRVKTDITPDKKAIADAIKAGKTVAGAHMERGRGSIRIK